MPYTMPALGSLESVDPDLLLHVSGGCHTRSCCCPPAPAPAPAMQQFVQTAPQVLPQTASSAPSGGAVTTNVSLNGQPAASA